MRVDQCASFNDKMNNNNDLLFFQIWRNIYLYKTINQFKRIYLENKEITFTTIKSIKEHEFRNYIEKIIYKGKGEILKNDVFPKYGVLNTIQFEYPCVDITFQENDLIPFGVESIQYAFDTNSSIELKKLPNSVTSVLNHVYTSTLEIIPLNITRFSIGLNSKFNEKIENNQFSSVTNLYLGTYWNNGNVKLSIGDIPLSISTLSIPKYIMGIDKFVLPSSITNLTISLKNTKLTKGVIPNSIKTLKLFGCNIITFEFESLPNSITNLDIHSKMIEYDNLFTFPNKLQYLYIMSDTTDKNNKEIISNNQLPSTLTELKIINLKSFSQSTIIGKDAFTNLKSLTEFEMYTQNIEYPLISNLKLPSSLKKLFINIPKIKETIITGFIPNGVTSLYIGCDFTININSLPNSITELSFENKNKPIEPNSIPQSVQSLYIHGNFNHPLTTLNLPCNLKELKFDDSGSFNHPINQLPTTLELLKLPKAFKFRNHTIPQSILDIIKKDNQ